MFRHLERLVIFDDELPAVSALSRSDLKMAERPKAKLSAKVGTHKNIDWWIERLKNPSMILFNCVECDCCFKTSSALLGQSLISIETLVVKPS